METEMPGMTDETGNKNEQESKSKLLHVSGMLEVGGSISFSIMNTRKGEKIYTNISPYVEISDNDFTRVNTIHDLYGGSDPHPTDDSKTEWRWRMTGKKALALLEEIKSSTPSLQDFTVAANRLYNESLSLEEKKGLVRSFQKEGENANRFATLSSQRYAELAKNLSFVAGAFDARGSESPREEWRASEVSPYGVVAPSVAIYTQNQALLEAFKGEYGGSISKTNERGQRRTIRGSEVIMKNDGFRWGLTDLQARTFLSAIQPYTRLRIIDL